MTTRTAIYVRISLDRIGAGLGVERQATECREYCGRKGWDVVDVYVDNDVSASSSKPRPSWLRLVADIKAGKIDSIVVWHIDRMTRQPRELEDVIDLADSHGLQLGTVTGEVDLSTPTGRLVARIMGATARHEAEHKAERQKSQRMQHAKAGKPNGGGCRPFGYQVDKISSVASEADLIVDAAARVLAGETLRSIVNEWNDNGITTVRGKLWTGSMLRQVLISARISGRREVGALQGKLGTIVHDDAWEAIIDPRTSDRLRTLLTDASRQSHTSSHTRKYLLSGLLICGKCGAKLTALDAKSARAPMYRCPSPGASSSVKSCGSLSVLMKYVEPTVRNFLLAAIDSPDLSERLRERVEVDPSIRAQIAHDEQELVEIAQDKSAGLLSRAEWLAMRESVSARLAANLATVARATDTDALSLLDGDGHIEDRWARLNLSQQRAIVADVYSEIKVLPSSGRGVRFTDERIECTFRF